jgi:Ca-activated chloride channel homolog
MKYGFVLVRCSGFRLIVLCGLTLLFVGSGKGQSADDIHISPRNNPSRVESSPSTTSPVSASTLPLDTNLFHVNVNLVLVPVSVSDSMNNPVLTLKKEDFALFEENKQQDIRYFMAEDAPASIAILLDVSKSMSGKIDIERAAIAEFLNNANPHDEYFAITFSDRPRLLANSMGSIDEFERKLTAIEPGGPTALLDAVYLGESVLRSARYQRKAILIFSDGGDNASQYTLREVKSLVRESDVQVYAIGLFETFFFNTLEEKLGKQWLSEITDATGGRTITVLNGAKVPEAAATISREMRNQYVLGYQPATAAPAKWRRIKVRITSSSSEHPLRAYYRLGYFSLR